MVTFLLLVPARRGTLIDHKKEFHEHLAGHAIGTHTR